MLLRSLRCTAVIMLAMTGIAAAQQNLPAATQQTATIKRTPLQKFDVPGTNYETVIGMAEIVPQRKYRTPHASRSRVRFYA